ncbi:DEAD/DEAH box helicase [Thiolapillus sp.]
MKLPTTEDIRRSCGNTYYNRGLSYQRFGKVLELVVGKEEEHEVFFTSRTLGSREQSYQQAIHIYRSGRFTRIDGQCSCPMYANCKHVAAACLEYIAQKNQPEPSGPRALEWLASLGDSEQEPEQPASREFLGYVLYLVPGSKTYSVDFKVLRRLKKGSLGKPRKTGYYALLEGYHSPAYLKPEDREILALLKAGNPRSWNQTKLRGAPGGTALALMAKSGRCYLTEASDENLLHWCDTKRRLLMQWQQEQPGLLSLAVDIEGGGHILPLDPVIYIDPETGETGYVDTGGFSARQVCQLLDAPLLNEASARELSQKLVLQFPELPLPPPIELEITEITGVTPIPKLTLFLNECEGNTAHMLELELKYGDHLITPLPVIEQTVIETPGQLIRIQRDLVAESKVAITLEDCGFTLSDLGDGRLGAFVPADSLPESAAIWKQFLDTELPRLEAAGWQFITHDSFALEFHETEYWWGELDEQDDGWFSMSLEVELEGERLPLLPLLGPVLEAYEPDDLPETLQIPFGDNRYLSVPGKKIRPWMEIIIELFDREPPDQDLRLSLFDAAQVADMDARGELEWQGGEKLRELGRRLRNFKQIEAIDPPEHFTGTLRDYQKTGYDWLHFLADYGLGGILADDMGLGKTVQTLAFLSNQKNIGKLDKPALIIAPTSLMSNWRREAESFTPELKVLVLQGPERHDRFALVDQHDLILTTYPLLPRDKEQLLDRSYSFLILDEAQVVKNPKAQAARIVRQIDTGQRLCLTGTPMENHLGELWTQFDFLMPGFLGDQAAFKRLYRTPIEKHGDQEKQARLSRRIAPFMLRRRKDEVEKDLPQKTEIIRSVPLSKNQAALYESIRLSMEKKVRDAIAAKGLARSHITILDALLKLRQTCCDPRLLKLKQAARVKESAKLDLLMEMLPEMLEEGRRILLFSQFTSMLGLIQKALDQKKIRYSKLTGQTRKRDAAIEHFVSGGADVFLISLKAGGVGLNLTAADTVIFYDPWWNPAVEAQAMDRAHRIGQDKPVFVYKLLTENTVEEKILALQEKKKNLAEAVYRQGGKQEKFQLDDKDLEVLFEPLT